jgi:hypothetical protein
MDRIQRLKQHLSLSKIKHDVQILNETTLKSAHAYCVLNNLSAQQYGPLLERFLCTKFNYVKNKAQECTGDCSKNGKNCEVKVSLGGATHTKFNYVQIRPSHDCDMYLLTAYNLSPENVETEGELYVFKVPKEEMKTLVVSYGGYAHGTVKKLGPITPECFQDNEYAIRPTLNDKCWNALLPFRIPESEL